MTAELNLGGWNQLLLMERTLKVQHFLGWRRVQVEIFDGDKSFHEVTQLLDRIGGLECGLQNEMIERKRNSDYGELVLFLFSKQTLLAELLCFQWTIFQVGSKRLEEVD